MDYLYHQLLLELQTLESFWSGRSNKDEKYFVVVQLEFLQLQALPAGLSCNGWPKAPGQSSIPSATPRSPPPSSPTHPCRMSG